MTAQADGTYLCDRCGGDAGNGGVFESLVVSDIKADEGGVQVVNLHFCRTRHEEDGTRTKGCDEAILSARNLENFHGRQEKYQRPERGAPPLVSQERAEDGV